MKKTKKLYVARETIRQLAARELQAADGGLSGDRCSAGLSGCGECDDRPSLTNTVCDACVQSDGCTYGCTGYPCQYP